MATNTSASARPDSDGIILPCRCASAAVDLLSDLCEALALDALAMTTGDMQRAREVSSVAWDEYAAASGAPSSDEISKSVHLPWTSLMPMAFAPRAARILSLWGMYAVGELAIVHERECPYSTDAQWFSPN